MIGDVFYIQNLEGITKSLIKGQNNFILHFRNKASAEFYSERRDEIMEVL